MDISGTPPIIPFDEAKRMASPQSARVVAMRRDRLASYMPEEGVAVGQNRTCSVNVGSAQGAFRSVSGPGFSSYGASAGPGYSVRSRPASQNVRLASPERSPHRLVPADDIFDDAQDVEGTEESSVVRATGGPRAALEMYERPSRFARKSAADKKAEAEERRRARAKERAARMFDRQFGADDDAASVSSSRAAVYKGEMGRNHKRAFDDLEKSRKSRSRATARSRGRGRESGGVVISLTPRFAIAAIALISAVIMLAFLHPTAQQFYLESREQARLQAEYDALSARNASMESRIAYLKTDEGIKDAARSELGWVEEGEIAGVVQGLDEGPSAIEGLYAQVKNGSVPAPVTWYSPMLDAFFGYVDPSTAVAENTDMTNLRDVVSDEAKGDAAAESAS